MEEQFKTLIVLSHYLEVIVATPLLDVSNILFGSMTVIKICISCYLLYPLVQTARFRQFWDEAAKSRNILETIPGILNWLPFDFFSSHFSLSIE